MPTAAEEEERKKREAAEKHMAVQAAMTPALLYPVIGWAAYGVGSVINIGSWFFSK